VVAGLIGWRVAAWQLPPIETAAVCSQPPIQTAAVFFFFCFFIWLSLKL
jgi:hypothetical protein